MPEDGQEIRLDTRPSWEADHPTYELPGECGNCGAVFRVLIRRGRKRPGSSFFQTSDGAPAHCPECGCSSVSCTPRTFSNPPNPDPTR